MKNNLLICFLAIVIPLVVAPLHAQLKLKQITAVGNSDEDEYLFFRIVDACFSDDEKHFYVIDSQRYLLRRYSIDGRFVGSYGRKGQGPHDFMGPVAVKFHDGEVYVHDIRNRKLAVFDAELRPVRSVRLPGPEEGAFQADFILTESNSFVFNGFQVQSTLSKGTGMGGRLLQFKNGKLRVYFDQVRFKKEDLNEMDSVLANTFLGRLSFGFNRERREILVSFLYASNPPVFYLLDAATGREKSSFSLDVDRNYVFPAALRRGGVMDKPGDRYMIVSNIFPFKDNYLVFYLFVNVLSGGAKQAEYRMQVVDRQGKAGQDILLEGQYSFYALSENGLLLAKNHDDEEDRIYVFRLE